MSVLIIAEHQNKKLSSMTRHAIQAGSQLGDVHVLLAGKDISSLAEDIKVISGVTKVLLAEAAHYEHLLAEEITPLILSLATSYRYFVASSSAVGKNIMPRVAALLDVPQISDVTHIVDENTFVHPVYTGNVLETVNVLTDKMVLTVRTTAFDAPELGGAADIETVAITEAQNLSTFLGEEINQSDRPELTEARVVVSGGRGLASKENFDKLMFTLADKLNAAVGASRAAVDADYAPNDIQVGQTGKIVAPELYIAVGIAGAIQHVAGMHESKVIVAINKDPDAPIFNVADYGLVGDLFELVPKLTELL